MGRLLFSVARHRLVKKGQNSKIKTLRDKTGIHTSRFVQFGHKGKHDHWMDYRVSNGDQKMAANEEAISSLLLRVYRAMTEEITPASNVEEELPRVFFPRVGAAAFVQSTSEQVWAKFGAKKGRLMHQSTPALPIPPGQPQGICSRCQSWEWGIRNFIAAPGAGH